MRDASMPRSAFRGMPRAEFRRTFFPHVSIEKRRRRGSQIHQNQRIERVPEAAVYIEAEQTSAGLQVLLDQNWHAFPVLLQFGDQRRKLFQFRWHAAHNAGTPEQPLIGTVW